MSNRVLNTHTFFDGEVSASVSASYLTDYRFGGDTDRTLMGTLTSGAEINIYAQVDPADTGIKHLVSTVSASSFSLVLDGPVAKITIEKVGSSGTANVQGLV